MSAPATMTVTNRLAEIGRLASFVADFGASHGVHDDVLFDVKLAVEEAVANVISHGYHDESEHQIVVRLALTDHALTVEVEDDARAFNPLEVAAPDVARPVTDRPVGGLGIHLIRNVMDALAYRRAGDKNVLIMTKHLTPA